MILYLSCVELVCVCACVVGADLPSLGRSSALAVVVVERESAAASFVHINTVESPRSSCPSSGAAVSV